MKRLWSILIALSMLFLLSTTSFATNEAFISDDQTKFISSDTMDGIIRSSNETVFTNELPALLDKKTVSIIDAQKPAQDSYTEFLEQLELDENGQYLYPDTFSGAFMDKDTYQLCIMLTELSPEIIAEYDHFFSDPSVVRYGEAEYSYNELAEIRDEIISNCKSITCIGIDEEENIIRVGVSDAMTKKLENSSTCAVEMTETSRIS